MMLRSRRKGLTRKTKRDKIKSKLNKGSLMTQKANNVTDLTTKSAPVDTTVYTYSKKETCDAIELNDTDPYLFELLEMLSFKRRHMTTTEELFCKNFMNGLFTADGEFIKFDKFVSPSGDTMAYYVTLSDDPVLWSCHVDSVHSGSGWVPVAYDNFLNVAYVQDESCPLGADDAAGMWILFQMIRAGIGGTYIFHKGEEVGGVGSRAMAIHQKEWLQGFKYAIAFDRKKTHSIITHQGFDRCCSDAFATSLANVLNRCTPMHYVLDDGGVFTDTANYTDLIEECTNLSCGYEFEHTQKEMLDVDFMVNLKDSLIKSFKDGFDELVCSRKKGETESAYDKYYGGNDWYGQYNKHGESYVNKNGYTGRSASSYKKSLQKFPSNSKLDRWAKLAAQTYMDVDDVAEVFFEENSTEGRAVCDVEFKDVTNHPDYVEFCKDVDDVVDKFQIATLEELVNFSASSSPEFTALILRRLLHDAGYV